METPPIIIDSTKTEGIAQKIAAGLAGSIVLAKNPWLVPAIYVLTCLARIAYAALVLCGTAYLVFWRGESGWLFAFAVFLLRFLRRF